MKRKNRHDATKKTRGLLRAGYKTKISECQAEWALNRKASNWKRTHQKTNVLYENLGKG